MLVRNEIAVIIRIYVSTVLRLSAYVFAVSMIFDNLSVYSAMILLAVVWVLAISTSILSAKILFAPASDLTCVPSDATTLFIASKDLSCSFFNSANPF